MHARLRRASRVAACNAVDTRSEHSKLSSLSFAAATCDWGDLRHRPHAAVRVQAATATPKPSGVEVPTRLNNTPQPRESRRWFYRDAAEGVCAALKTRAPRLKMRLIVPETNPEMDVFRVGTLLEMVREVATAAALDGRRVRVCVQGSMGQGVFQGLPLSLSGACRPARRQHCHRLVRVIARPSTTRKCAVVAAAQPAAPVATPAPQRARRRGQDHEDDGLGRRGGVCVVR